MIQEKSQAFIKPASGTPVKLPVEPLPATPMAFVLTRLTDTAPVRQEANTSHKVQLITVFLFLHFQLSFFLFSFFGQADREIVLEFLAHFISTTVDLCLSAALLGIPLSDSLLLYPIISTPQEHSTHTLMSSPHVCTVT